MVGCGYVLTGRSGGFRFLLVGYCFYVRFTFLGFKVWECLQWFVGIWVGRCCP